ncbi:Malonate-semialdehyde dehydrogenase 1 [Bienertia sinuspersici]
MVVELFVLGCSAVVMFFHGAHLLFHALTSHVALRSLSFLGFVGW